MAEKQTPNGRGLGVDAAGGPVVDPTANVVALTNSANQRQDDLREKYWEAQISNIKEMVALRASYETRLSGGESRRIDAIRAVDVQASAVDREKQAASAAVLANQVSISADALRTLVSTTGSTIAEQQRIQYAQFSDRLTAVERSQYEGRGKAGMADPMMAELVAEMKSLSKARDKSSGTSEGGQAVWGYIALGVSLLAIVLSGAFALVNLNSGT